ncbi:MAG: hypothetical protein JRH19_26485 [Deltaproteobacteria bacterium]|nr:hypothetical protein [Deltaproteobacteria bacterium]
MTEILQRGGEEWERIESPLRELDGTLDAFAKRHGMELTKNFAGWPERSLTWTDGVERKIQVLLGDEQSLRFNVWIMACEDRADGRFWKRKALANGLPLAVLREKLPDWLDEGQRLLTSWSAEDLVRATG